MCPCVHCHQIVHMPISGCDIMLSRLRSSSDQPCCRRLVCLTDMYATLICCVQMSKLQSAAPTAATVADAAPASPSASSLESASDMTYSSGSGSVMSNDAPAVTQAAGTISDAAGLVLANAAVSQSSGTFLAPMSQADSSRHASIAELASSPQGTQAVSVEHVSHYLLLLLLLPFLASEASELSLGLLSMAEGFMRMSCL